MILGIISFIVAILLFAVISYTKIKENEERELLKQEERKRLENNCPATNVFGKVNLINFIEACEPFVKITHYSNHFEFTIKSVKFIRNGSEYMIFLNINNTPVGYYITNSEVISKIEERFEKEIKEKNRKTAVEASLLFDKIKNSNENN